MKRSLLFGLGIGSALAWAGGCGSSNDDSNGGKHSGGSAGSGARGGTAGSSSGSAGKSTGGATTGGATSGGAGGSSGGESGASGEAGSPSGGAGMGGSSAGTAGGSGEGGEGGQSGPECPMGKAECDGNLDALCETTLASDAEHCGICGRDCTIGDATCTNGLCDPVTLFTAADMAFGTDSGGARTWAFDPASASLVWVGFNGYTVWRYPTNGSARALIWDPSVNMTAGTESAVVVGGEVYWSVGGSPPIVYKKAVTASSTVAPTDVFHPVARASFLRVMGSKFYWMSGDYQDPTPTPPAHTGFVYSRDISAGSDPGTPIVTGDQGNFGNITGFQPTSNALYWVTNQAGSGVAYELRTAPIGGGTPTVVPRVPGAASAAISAVNEPPPSFVASGQTLYFTVTGMSPGVNGIYRYKTGDSAPSLVVAADRVTSMLIDASFVYYVANGEIGTFKVPLTGGTGVSLSATNGQKLVGQDATYLYLLQSGCCNSILQRIIK